MPFVAPQKDRLPVAKGGFVAPKGEQLPPDDPMGRAYREALETTGTIAGGVAGGLGGEVVEPAGGGLLAVPGAALGRAGGTAAANFIDFLRGRQQKTLPEQVKEEAGSAVSGAEAEMGGQVGGELIQGAAQGILRAAKAPIEGLVNMTTFRPGAGRVALESPEVTKSGFFTGDKVEELAKDISSTMKQGREMSRAQMEGMGNALAKSGKMADTKPVFDALESTSKRLKLADPLPAVPNSDAKTVGGLIKQVHQQLSDVVDVPTMRQRLDEAAGSLGKKGIVENVRPIQNALSGIQRSPDFLRLPPQDQNLVINATDKAMTALTTPVPVQGTNLTAKAPIEETSVADLLKIRHALDDDLSNVNPKSPAAKILSDFRDKMNSVIFNKAPALKTIDEQYTAAAASGEPIITPKTNVDAETLLRLRHRLDDEINYASQNKTPTEAALTELRQKVDSHIAKNFPEVKTVDAQYKAMALREKSLSSEFGIKPGKPWEDYTAEERNHVQEKITSALKTRELPRQVLQDIDNTLGTNFLQRAEQLSAAAPFEPGGKPVFERATSPQFMRRLGYLTTGGGGVTAMIAKNPAYLAAPFVAGAATSPRIVGAGVRALTDVAGGAVPPVIPAAIKAIISRRKTQQEMP